jgi:hypothetical protein
MSNERLRDAFCIVNMDEGYKQVFKDDYIEFDEELAVKKDKGGYTNYIGEVSCYLEDIDEVGSFVETLRNANIAPHSTDTYVMLNPAQLNTFGFTGGVVVGTQGNLIVLYLGVLELQDNMEAIPYSGTADVDVNAFIEALDLFGETLFDKYEEETEDNESEENSIMDNIFNGSFGKLRTDRFKLSMNGIAVYQPSSEKYIVYNKANNEFVDVNDLLFDIKDALFLLPAVEVAAGDTILHEGKPYYVVDTRDGIKAVSYEDCVQTTLIPKSTMFGIKYFTKVFSMFGDNFASTKDIFSNPMMLMALMDGKNSDLTQLMLMNSLSKGDLASNPMALAMLLKGDKGDSSLSTLAMMSMFNNGTNPFAPAKANRDNNKSAE